MPGYASPLPHVAPVNVLVPAQVTGVTVAPVKFAPFAPIELIEALVRLAPVRFALVRTEPEIVIAVMDALWKLVPTAVAFVRTAPERSAPVRSTASSFAAFR